MIKFFFFILLIVFISGCTTLSKKECETMNWESAGYNSALKGEPAGSQIRELKNLCVNRYNTSIDAEAFARGYEKGQAQYCTELNLYKLGISGQTYKGICDNHSNGRSVKSFGEGRIQYLESQVSSLENENNILKAKIIELESKLNSCKY